MWRRCRPSVEKIWPATKSPGRFASLMNPCPAPLLEKFDARCSVSPARRCLHDFLRDPLRDLRPFVSKRVLPNPRTHLDVETLPPHSQIIDQPGVDIDPQP